MLGRAQDKLNTDLSLIKKSVASRSFDEAPSVGRNIKTWCTQLATQLGIATERLELGDSATEGHIKDTFGQLIEKMEKELGSADFNIEKAQHHIDTMKAQLEISVSPVTVKDIEAMDEASIMQTSGLDSYRDIREYATDVIGLARSTRILEIHKFDPNAVRETPYGAVGMCKTLSLPDSRNTVGIELEYGKLSEYPSGIDKCCVYECDDPSRVVGSLEIHLDKQMCEVVLPAGTKMLSSVDIRKISAGTTLGERMESINAFFRQDHDPSMTPMLVMTDSEDRLAHIKPFLDVKALHAEKIHKQDYARALTLVHTKEYQEAKKLGKADLERRESGKKLKHSQDEFADQYKMKRDHVRDLRKRADLRLAGELAILRKTEKTLTRDISGLRVDHSVATTSGKQTNVGIPVALLANTRPEHSLMISTGEPVPSLYLKNNAVISKIESSMGTTLAPNVRALLQMVQFQLHQPLGDAGKDQIGIHIKASPEDGFASILTDHAEFRQAQDALNCLRGSLEPFMKDRAIDLTEASDRLRNILGNTELIFAMRENVDFKPIQLPSVGAKPLGSSGPMLHTMNSPESRAKIFYSQENESSRPIPRFVMEVRNTSSLLNKN